MNRLYTVAYPELNARDRAFIDDFRLHHHRHFGPVIAPHYTLVFGCAAVPAPDYLRHAQAVANSTSVIPFCCRYAMLGADDEDDTAYVFFVPDEGYAQISLLHDRLYTGPLASHLRLDLPYIPHITVGRLGSRTEAKALCDELNRRGLEIHGALGALSVGAIREGVFTELATYAMQSPAQTGLGEVG